MSDTKKPAERDPDPSDVKPPDPGVPPGAAEGEPMGWPDTGRHKSETEPHSS